MLSANIQREGTTLTSFSGSFEGTLQPGDTAIYTFPSYFTALPASAYELTIDATTEGDEVEANNHLTATKESGSGGTAPDARAFICEEMNTAILLSSGPETVYWYKEAIGTDFIGAGDTVSTIFNTGGSTFYAAVNDFRGQIGPRKKTAFPPEIGRASCRERVCKYV